MLCSGGSAGAQESITEQISARTARITTELVIPSRKQDLALMEREGTGGAGMKEHGGGVGVKR